MTAHTRYHPNLVNRILPLVFHPHHSTVRYGYSGYLGAHIRCNYRMRFKFCTIIGTIIAPCIPCLTTVYLQFKVKNLLIFFMKSGFKTVLAIQMCQNYDMAKTTYLQLHRNCCCFCLILTLNMSMWYKRT